MTDNELQLYKRLLFGAAMVSNRTDMNEVNQMISDANRAAYDSLDDADRVHVKSAVEMLKANTSKGLGDAGALELIAALAQVMGGDNGKEGRDEQIPQQTG